jgi:putative transposase
MNFLPNEFYHIYNRGNNKQIIFLEDDNYTYFIQKITIELAEYVDVVAYCLMPNHYHILIYTTNDFDDTHSKILNRKLGTLQSSYTQAFNKRFNRSGSLFQQKVKRKCLDRQDNQAFICFHYIHQNPLKAGLVNNMVDWQYSSFKEYLDKGMNKTLNKKTAYDLLAIPQEKDLFLKESLGVIVFNDGY